MASTEKLLLVVFPAICLLLLLTAPISTGRGVRGGGGVRGTSRISRTTNTRTTTRYTSRSTSYTRGARYGGFGWKSAAAAGYLYGYSRFSHRRRYMDNPHSEPSICQNHFDYSMGNGTRYTYFICPMYEQPESYTYCCGPANRQKCCGFGDSPGRVAGVVIGCLFFVALIGGCFYCFCCKNKRGGTDGVIITTAPAKRFGRPGPGPRPNYPQPVNNYQPGIPSNQYPTPAGIPPYKPPPAGIPPYKPPPAYPPQGGGPGYPGPPGGPAYPVQPGGPAFPPPTGGPGFFPPPAPGGPMYPVQPGGPAYPPAGSMYPPPQQGMNDPNNPMGMPPPAGMQVPPGDLPPNIGMPQPEGTPSHPLASPGQPTNYPPPPAYPGFNIPPDASAPPPPSQPPL